MKNKLHRDSVRDDLLLVRVHGTEFNRHNITLRLRLESTGHVHFTIGPTGSEGVVRLLTMDNGFTDVHE